MNIKLYMAKIIVLLLISITTSKAQFLDEFNKDKIDGWFAMVGDGTPEMRIISQEDYATIFIDGTKDKYNVYWTLIKRDVTKWLDLTKLKDSNFQLRVEAKVRVHNAPRRLNFMVNTNRTVNFHIDLMEFDIPDTTNWHVISMTTKKFDAKPGDTVYVQMAATDYGLEKYQIDIDYYRADIVNIKEAGPDKGILVPYHPPIPNLKNFANQLAVKHDCVINLDFPEVNFNDLHIKERNENIFVLDINTNQWGILRWDFSKYRDAKITEAGLLELTSQSVTLGGNYVKALGEDFGMEFGKVRVIEILSGDPLWDQSTVTYNTLTQNEKYSNVFNTQMVYDFDVEEGPVGKNYITISKPVLQRLVDGTTKGLLIRPLGAVDASFYASENQDESNSAKLYFNNSNGN
ncbi:MAG: hypothetical protein KDC52_17280 [Ignavibacteriae bacterium]|nr:hypothetical protein [Ignavibacteriota bacterium]